MRDVPRVALLAAVALLGTACAQSQDDSQDDISFFVLVKSSNYAQNTSGDLTFLNYHFFSEIFVNEGVELLGASLTTPNRPDAPRPYEDRGTNYYMEGGHFDSVEELDAAYPNGTFVFDIQAPSVSFSNETMELAGPGGETAIPAPITISLAQAGADVSPLAIDPNEELVIRWSEYSGGSADPRGIVDDMIFVVVADCHGERLVHTGLPFQGEHLTFRAKELSVAAGTLGPGLAYSMFVEFPSMVDSRIIQGVPAFTSYATATYLDLRTTGVTKDTSCPDVAPPMDTGQTDRMDLIQPDTTSGR